jgi:hypothetical protein
MHRIIVLHRKDNDRTVWVRLDRDRIEGNVVIRSGERIEVRESVKEIARLRRNVGA